MQLAPEVEMCGMGEHEVRASYIEGGKSHRMILPGVAVASEQVVELLRDRYPHLFFYCWCSSAGGPCLCAEQSVEDDLLGMEMLKQGGHLKPVSSIMSRPVISAGPDAEVTKVLAAMSEHDIQHVPVRNGAGELVGIISDRDILRSLSPVVGTAHEQESDAQTLSRKAHQIMRRRVATVPADVPVAAVFLLMAKKRVHCLPVMQGRQVVGIITPTDLILAYCGLKGHARPAEPGQQQPGRQSPHS